jgi:hypothetical protein
MLHLPALRVGRTGAQNLADPSEVRIYQAIAGFANSVVITGGNRQT